MAIRYKCKVLDVLKAAGYSSYRMRKEKIFGEATLTLFREGRPVNFDNLSKVCMLSGCQPGDLLEYVPDEVNTGETTQQSK